MIFPFADHKETGRAVMENNKKPTPRQMIEWLESYFDCDDIHNNCPEPKWAIHIRDFIKEHGHVS